MTIRRVTAREFQKRFQRYEEPVLVNNGIFFPEIDVELHDHAEAIGTSTGTEKSSTQTSEPLMIKTISGKPYVGLSKKDQAKGKMAR